MKANIRKGTKRVFRVLAWIGFAFAFLVGCGFAIAGDTGVAFLTWILWCPIFFYVPIGVGKLIFYIADGFREDEKE